MSVNGWSRYPFWGYDFCRILLGGVFLYAAIQKLISPQAFADNLAAYHLLPFSLVDLLALGLPLFEFTCGLLVLTGFLLRVGLLGILALLTVFITAFSLALLRGISIDCGCFGTPSWWDSNPWMVLIRDGILLGIAAYLYRWNVRTTDSIDQRE